VKIGFLGAGKMARALASGLVRGGLVFPGDILFSSRTADSGSAFLNQFPEGKPSWTSDHGALVAASDLIVLAVKPHQMGEVLAPLREVSAEKLFLSLAAGVTLAQIAGWLHPTSRIVRAMPNTPMQIGLGASVYAGQPGMNEADLALVRRVLGSAGQAWEVEESQINAVTALSGSGPAYVFHFIDALVRAALPLGLDEELARALALQTVLGSAQLAAQSELSPLDLAAQVKSPGGTTLAGCAVLEENGALNDLMVRCLAAAKARADVLARGGV
jgi:pyrroline-5-carboxylate reductase